MPYARRVRLAPLAIQLGELDLTAQGLVRSVIKLVEADFRHARSIAGSNWAGGYGKGKGEAWYGVRRLVGCMRQLPF